MKAYEKIEAINKEIDKAYENKRSIELIEKLERKRDDLLSHTCYKCMLNFCDLSGLCKECKNRGN